MRKKWIPYLLLIPSIVFITVFVILPLFYTVYLSFFKWNMIKEKKFVGLDNYINLFTNNIFYMIIIQTLMYILLLILFNTVVTYIFAFIVDYFVKKQKKIYQTALFLPSVISLVVGSMIFLWILNPVTGPIAKILGLFGLTMPNWAITDGWVIFVISLIVAWKVFGYNFLVLYSSIIGIPREIIEAAKIDNIPPSKIFLNIVLPMSSATGFYILILTIVQGLQYVFTPISVITKGGPNYKSSNLIYHAYHEGFTLYNTGTSAAVSTITMIIFFLLLIIQFMFVERRVAYEN
ncbi:sugar ABC transporter permease [Staphylococcus hominis]|uniref:carbohydrate ABC transporter permease n=1 Tax=Staphylococcus hominis TaxID=1290 RepID=UPI001F59F46B|nr:sugar ABC transporter permease [Staphylococcus hominis]MCI2899048.1 sugar ABC transporter permease [Staphylococcus hominis]